MSFDLELVKRSFGYFISLNMLWKIISVLCAASLIGSCFYAWTNKQDLEAEKAREAFAQANLKKVQENKTQQEAALSAKKNEQEKIQKDLVAAKEETVKLAAQVQEKEISYGIVKNNLDQVKQQVSAVEKEIAEAGDIEKLIAQIEKLKKDQEDLKTELAKQDQLVADARKTYQDLVAETARLRDVEAKGRRGIVAADFSAKIAQFLPEWNLAIINKGNLGGVFSEADLDVRRGERVIAKLKVKNVEQNGSVAELVRGSLAQGERILSGDTVVASPEATAKAEAAAKAAETAKAARAAAAPAAASAPAAAPAAAPMAADPFGAPAAAPAAAAPMAADPFGAAPAAPAPAAADPFGAAPAKPAGTVDKPNTDDPFAPAPKKP